MPRILFLDDCPSRRREAARELAVNHVFVGCTTAHDAIQLIEANIKRAGRDRPAFDRVYLDHDLTEERYCDSSRKDCGYEVVRWIVANRPRLGPITVHTLFTQAGNLMVRDLRAVGYEARYAMFTKLFMGELPW